MSPSFIPFSNGGAPARSRSGVIAAAVAVVAATAAAVGWTRTPTPRVLPARSITISDIRPLLLADPALRDVASHLFAVRVAIRGWELLAYRPGAAARPGAGYWRLYLDGRSLGDTYGDSHVGYTPYLVPGEHWIAAELRNADSSALDPPVWSEPIVLRVPRVIRCWQSGWRGAAGARSPTFSCFRAGSRRRHAAVPRPVPQRRPLGGRRDRPRRRVGARERTSGCSRECDSRQA